MMLKRGRKSRADLSVIPLVRTAPKLLPPPSLSEAGKKLFASLVSAAPHLEPCDLPLLTSYVTTTLLLKKTARRAGADPAALRDYERLTKLQLALGTRLRVSPQSRSHPRTVTRALPPPGHRPWERYK